MTVTVGFFSYRKSSRDAERAGRPDATEEDRRAAREFIARPVPERQVRNLVDARRAYDRREISRVQLDSELMGCGPDEIAEAGRRYTQRRR